jgi:DNA adenine methylase
MLIRYPGSKAKLAPRIVSLFPDETRLPLWTNAAGWEYREPFFGAGAVGFYVLDALDVRSRVVLGDLDPWLVLLWNAVLRAPDELKDLIRSFTPSADRFYEFKASDGRKDVDPVKAGFQKLALHQMSVSGFGAMSGGPIGGKNQESALYKVGCRWSAHRLARHVTDCNRKLRRFRDLSITCRDFSQTLSGLNENSFVYLDPPYVAKGGMLYRYSMDEGAHARLADTVKALPCAWALSYDDHPMIRDLYAWADIRELRVTYSNATLRNGEAQRPKNREILIRPRMCA